MQVFSSYLGTYAELPGSTRYPTRVKNWYWPWPSPAMPQISGRSTGRASAEVTIISTAATPCKPVVTGGTDPLTELLWVVAVALAMRYVFESMMVAYHVWRR